MDDARIEQLTEEVFRQLRGPAPAGELEERVSALEKAVAELSAGSWRSVAGRAPGARSPRTSASSVLLQVSSAREGEECVLEPGQPCTGSGRCRAFGH